MVPSLANVLLVSNGSVQILAASLKSPEQVSRAVMDGAHAVTVPMSVLAQLADNPLSESAIAEFERVAASRG